MSVLLVWMVLLVALNGVRWFRGFPTGALVEGVEQGAAHAEFHAKGVSTEEQIRKLIRSQRETISFWTVLSGVGDFLIEPVVLAGRALVVATVFTGLAALAGRAIHYDCAIAESARLQGLWLLGLALRVALLVGLRRPESEVETSLAVFLPPGTYPAPVWISLRQLDVFALIGWAALGVAGWRRGDVPLWVALGLCCCLGLMEIAARTCVGLLFGAAIRLKFM